MKRLAVFTAYQSVIFELQYYAEEGVGVPDDELRHLIMNGSVDPSQIPEGMSDCLNLPDAEGNAGRGL